ncbi:MAG: CBS domain-containing protein [Acidimicrobiia bacterium]
MFSESLTVVWTRGEGCSELTEALAPDVAVRAKDDLAKACIDARADLLVVKGLSSFGLVSAAMPHDFVPDQIGSITAAVGGGPHSLMAGWVARRLGKTLGVEAEMVCAFRREDERVAAEATVKEVAAEVADLPFRVAHVPSAGKLVEQLGPESLLVVGAPGGSWLQRQFFGPGARLKAKAPGGVVVVHMAPVRAFQRMGEPNWVSSRLRAADARLLMTQPVTPVAEEGKMVGIVRLTTVRGAPDGALVTELMEDPLFVEVGEPVEEASSLVAFFEGAPIPVVDDHGRLLGSLHPEDVGPPGDR